MKANVLLKMSAFVLAAVLLAAFSMGAVQRTCASSGQATAFSIISSNSNIAKDHVHVVPAGTPEQILYRKGYTASYNNQLKIPNWVAWRLTREHTTGKVKRPGSAWHEDEDVPLPRATIYDYRQTKWTRGHMCPAGDNKWDEEAMYDTFLFTNCCPQNANLNSGVWNQIEMSCRRWAQKFGEIYIVCGPVLFRQEHETIGTNKVVVPEAFFKVVLCLEGTPRGIGFICRNTDGGRKRDAYVNSISQVERITGITFFPQLPKSIAETVKSQADLTSWD